MNPDLIPTKTAAARQLLASSRAALAPGLRMLLITVDGRKTLAELLAVECALGLQGRGLQQLQADGLIAGGAAALPAAKAPDAMIRLVRAKMFALDLVGRMLAGRDQGLRDAARRVDSESRFLLWLDDCAAEIAQVADAERAAAFRQRVAAAAG